MNELKSKTLAQIVTRDHRTASVFEKYNLDFCCKGRRSLQQACEEIKLPVDQLVGELEATIKSSRNTVDFDNMSLSQLTDYIVATHHDYVKREMPQIFMYLQKVAAKHGIRHPEMLRVFEAFSALKEEMEQHMQKEEQMMFPRIKMLEQEKMKGHFRPTPGYIMSPVSILEQEHDHAGALMHEIKELTKNYVPPQDACTTYRLSFAALQAFEADLHQHVHLENNILFPKAGDLIDNQVSLN
jgi:regulator of cell morphogenesis and NO signaling